MTLLWCWERCLGLLEQHMELLDLLVLSGKLLLLCFYLGFQTGNQGFHRRHLPGICATLGQIIQYLYHPEEPA